MSMNRHISCPKQDLSPMYGQFEIQNQQGRETMKGILISQGYCYKLGYLKTTEIYFSTVLESRNSKSNRTVLPFVALKERPLLASQLLLVPGIPWLWPHHYNLCLCRDVASSSSLCLSEHHLSFSYKAYVILFSPTGIVQGNLLIQNLYCNNIYKDPFF